MHYFDELVALMAQLRTSCPWDKKQTHQSLLPYLLEESHELVCAIEEGDPVAIKDELGDVLLQVIFHSQLYAETNAFTVRDVVEQLTDKLIRRHPHIFASSDNTCLLSDDEVKKLWDNVKAQERPKSDETVFFKDKAGTALMKAEQAGKQTASVGFDFANWQEAFAKVEEELAELKAVLTQGDDYDTQAAKDELGDCFFALTNLARQLQINSELATLASVHKFQRRFEFVYHKLGQDIQQADPQTMEQVWQQAKNGC